MTRVRTILDVWWELAGIFSGGLLGLFLLGRMSPRTGNAAAGLGVACGVLAILWMTFSTKPWWPADLEHLQNPLHPLLTIVVGTLVILAVGLAASVILPRRTPDR